MTTSSREQGEEEEGKRRRGGGGTFYCGRGAGAAFVAVERRRAVYWRRGTRAARPLPAGGVLLIGSGVLLRIGGRGSFTRHSVARGRPPNVRTQRPRVHCRTWGAPACCDAEQKGAARRAAF